MEVHNAMLLEQEQAVLLANQAKKAYENAYAPYSGYKVGAAVLWHSGRITSGANIENASYGLTVCAERNAVYQGVLTGEKQIFAIAIAVPALDMPSPCGACRQVIREFASDCIVILLNGQGDMAQTRLQVLLPEAFGPEFLYKVSE
ncbi:cytidine deaminase [Dehalobacter sp. DCM]|uniref:cytidine deaminase n=1 Tax=Dehalobacter sp. DCM TaxID=2907827 RepID=UPI0030816E8A|nr:cytidine deaminase [Dehalobacter sp. DCM]